MLYFSDIEEEIFFAITESKEVINKKIIYFLSNTFGREFEEVSSDWAEDITIETPTLVIKVQFFNEDLLELIEMGVDIHIVK